MSNHSPDPPPTPHTHLDAQGNPLIHTWRAKRNWRPRKLSSGRVEYMEDTPSWEEVYLTPEENQKEMQHQREQNLQREQQDQGQDQEQPGWCVPTPEWEEPSGDAYMEGMWDDGNMRDDDDADVNSIMKRTYPSRGPTPFSGFDDDTTAAQQPQYHDPAREQPISPAEALGPTDNDQQPPAGASAEMAGSPEGEGGEEKGRQGGRRKRRVIGPPVEGRRQSSRIRTKTNRMAEKGG